MNRKYRLTALACYVGYVGQAVICNFQPLLFLTFERTWGITPAKLSLLIAVNFITQLLVDLGSVKLITR